MNFRSCVVGIALLVLGCEGAQGDPGERGPAGEQGPAGARGEPGLPGLDGAELAPYLRWDERLAQPGDDVAVFAFCDDGDHVIGGGCDWSDARSIAGYPLQAVEDVPSSWVCIARDVGTESFIHARVVCSPAD